jgi:hypothetical protein
MSPGPSGNPEFFVGQFAALAGVEPEPAKGRYKMKGAGESGTPGKGNYARGAA